MVEEQNAVEGLIFFYQRLVDRNGTAEGAGIAEGVEGRIVEHVVHVVGEKQYRDAVGDAGPRKG